MYYSLEIHLAGKWNVLPHIDSGMSWDVTEEEVFDAYKDISKHISVRIIAQDVKGNKYTVKPSKTAYRGE